MHNYNKTLSLFPDALHRYVNLEEELKKVYVGQYRKKQKKFGDSSKTLDRNYFSRIKVRLFMLQKLCFLPSVTCLA